MINYRDKKLVNKLDVLEANIITIKKNMSLAQRIHFFTGRVPNDRHCVVTVINHLSY